MGCDIHLHTEVKIDGKWHHYSAPSISRSYSIFAKMAGVRKDAPTPLAPPRGLPADATELTLFDYYAVYGSEAHTPSWLNAAEIAELVDWIAVTFPTVDCRDWECSNIGYLFGNTFSGFSKYPRDYSTGARMRIEDVRWLFWFDN